MRKILIAIVTGLSVALLLLGVASFTIHAELFNFDFSGIVAQERFLIASLTLTLSVGSAGMVMASSVGESK